MKRIYLLRHAETFPDLDDPSKEWCLTPDGVASSKHLASQSVFNDVRAIYSSTESKAIDTARPIAESIGLPILTKNCLCELQRGLPLSSNEEYESVVREMFERLEPVLEDWEHPLQALNRFQVCVDAIQKESDAETVLIVSHGLVLTLYFASLLKSEDYFHRWKSLSFLAYGSVVDGTIEQDII